MRNNLLFWILLLSFLACRSKSEMPGGILPAPKMQSVLWDLMRADQFLTDYVLNKDSTARNPDINQQYYQYIFAQHQVSKEQFEKSFKWYREHPLVFRALLDSIAAPPKEPVPAALNTPDTAVKVATPPVNDSAIKQPATANPAIDSVAPKRRIKKVSGN